jgi:CO/xanthine dehydrogenase Mo-binding subunit/aerobic-type carbon monoxide dehydrogenase small subunit (CoxS/CutS family)
MRATFRLQVNGQERVVSVAPETPLLLVLRNDLGLKGPKVGCAQEQCGVCKVLVDGQAVPSCKLPVHQVVGLPIITIEGLAGPAGLHPLQQAFIEEGAIQCGYCVTGMIVAAEGLLRRRRYPSDAEIREALNDNLCRCGVYDRVRRAIRLRIGQPHDPQYTVVEAPAVGARPAEWELPAALIRHPYLDQWLRFNADDSVTVFTGKVEYGQGIKTAVAQIAAEELGVDLDRVEVVMADTGRTPDEGMTVSSMSLETTGRAVRLMAAEARRQLLQIAYEELEAPLERLVVDDGVILDPATGRRTTYWALRGGRPFGTQLTAMVETRPPGAYQIVGQAVTRIDLPPKVSGMPSFVHDMSLPDMVHARVVRPSLPGARLTAVDPEALAGLEEKMTVVRDGDFLAVAGSDEESVIQAAEQLAAAAHWAPGDATLPEESGLWSALMDQAIESLLIEDGFATEQTVPPVLVPLEAAATLHAEYSRPYQLHAALAPSAALAWLQVGQLTVWAHGQGAYPLRAALAHVLGLAEQSVRVIHAEGSGCYGHNGADDVALDAALVARAVPGIPVLLKWTRADENAHEPCAPAMRIALSASLDGTGRVLAWNYDGWSLPHGGRAQPEGNVSGLLASWSLAKPFERPRRTAWLGAHAGGHRNADPLYAFAQKRIVKHFMAWSPLRTSSMRGLGAFANAFAIESFVDELAEAAGSDPIEFRLRHLTDERARAVLEAAAEKASWISGPRPGRTGRGRGVAFSQYKNRQTYAAAVVDLTVDTDTGRIALERVVLAADAGQIINPDGLSNQLEGGFVQAASWTLKEAVRFGPDGIRSLDWEGYPILTFAEAPVIETVLLNRPEHPTVGAGEAALGPAGGAIANAIYDAVGVRLRRLPLTPERVLTALAGMPENS